MFYDIAGRLSQPGFSLKQTNKKSTASVTVKRIWRKYPWGTRVRLDNCQALSWECYCQEKGKAQSIFPPSTSLYLCKPRICSPANLENSAVATGLEKSIFIPIPKKGNAKECSNYHTLALISHASKVMLKILQARLQQYMYCDSLMFKLVLERQRNQRSNCQHPLDHGKSKRVPEKHLFLLYWLCQSLWLCGSQ